MDAPLKILLADDHVDAADTTADLLRLDGHEVRVTYDGLQAVEAARSFRPDVAILDINMPVLDGYKAAALLRKTQGMAERLVLIAVTGESRPEDVERASRAGSTITWPSPSPEMHLAFWSLGAWRSKVGWRDGRSRALAAIIF